MNIFSSSDFSRRRISRETVFSTNQLIDEPGRALMKGTEKNGNGASRMELKYCERCGGLWIRECGAGVVYCGNCQLKVADLPSPRKKRERIKMPVRPHTLVEDYAIENEDDLNCEAAGGAA
jgi:hypothetical protein